VIKTRVGVIGGGAMGQHHIRIYSEMKDVELIGICDTDRDRASVKSTFKSRIKSG